MITPVAVFGVLLVVLMLSAGWAKLCSMAINRLHGLGWRRTPLDRLKLVHDLLVLGHPFVWWWAPWSFITSGDWWTEVFASDWSHVPAGWLLLALIDLVGVGWLLAAMGRWWLRGDPAQVATRQTWRFNWRTVDWARAHTPARQRWLLCLWLNEQLAPILSERVIALPSWPAAWHGIRIAHLTDLHLHAGLPPQYFEQLVELVRAQQPDLIVLTGDLVDDDIGMAHLADVLGSLRAPLGQYFVLGNHDWYYDSPRIRETMQAAGWTCVADSSVVLERGGERLCLAGDERPWQGAAPEWPSEPAARVLLSHTPDNFAAAQHDGVDLMLAGHVHGGQVCLPVLGPVFSPSLFGLRYVGGVFMESNTTLIVSRGLGGFEPIRLLCPPELTIWEVQRGERPALTTTPAPAAPPAPASPSSAAP